MCEPTTIISIGMAVASAAAQAKQAKNQEKAANEAYQNEQMQIQEKYRQENDQLNQEMSQRSREALSERGRLRAAYGESGLGGNSLDNIMRENEFTLGQDLSTMEANRGNLKRQTQMNLKGAHSTAQSRMNSIERPSLVSTGLQIAGHMAGDKKVKSYFN